MKQKSEWSPGPGVQVLDVERIKTNWVVHTLAIGPGCCPVCSTPSKCRHGWNTRWLQDLPAQGMAVKVSLRQARWRCGNAGCERITFVDPMPRVALPFSRRTQRVGDLAVLLAHATGGRPAARLMKRLGLTQSDDTLLRSLKRRAATGRGPPVRVVGIDDWSWRKGSTYGTILVDLERRQVLDVLADRSAATTADWLDRHPEVEIVSRDRCGLYAQGAIQGAPQARQVADRFHLLQNLRQGIEKQMMRASHQEVPVVVAVATPDFPPPPAVVFERYGRPEVMEHRHQLQVARIASGQCRFKRVKALHAEGKSFTTITRETGLHWRSVAKWAGLDMAPVRRTMAAKTTTPERFRAHLARRWSEGCTMGRTLLAEIKLLGYTGSFTHLQRLLCKWRQAHFAAMAGVPAQQAAIAL